jgi:hypothetical protein
MKKYKLYDKARRVRNIPDDGGDTFSKTSVLTRVTRPHIPGDGIPKSHRRENLKSNIALIAWAL